MYPKISSQLTVTGDRCYTLRNRHGMQIVISDFGATLISWLAPDRDGRMADILLGYHSPAEYRQNHCYFGSLIGRCANRIANGRFAIDGKSWQLELNEGDHHLHGGFQGFHQRRWRSLASRDSVDFMLDSPAGEAGYPANLSVRVRFSLDDSGCLRIDYFAIADAATPINLTSHPYFNLNGGETDIGDHLLSITADQYLPVDAAFIPLPAQLVTGTAFDFRQPATIGTRLSRPDPQLKLARGFNHCYVLQPAKPTIMSAPVAMVYDAGSGRELRLYTSEQGLQFYSGNQLDGVVGRGAAYYRRQAGFCLEAQAFPNQINTALAERMILRPGQAYRQTTVYQLSVRSAA